MSNPKSSRKYFALIDGIIAGEGEGPLAPDAKPCGLIIAGQNPVAVDATCAWLMGFDINKIQFTNQTFKLKENPLTNFPAEDVDILSNEKNWEGKLGELQNVKTFKFNPHFGWKGAIERNQ
jgi:uncharacterized protein (DUF362 family)